MPETEHENMIESVLKEEEEKLAADGDKPRGVPEGHYITLIAPISFSDGLEPEKSNYPPEDLYIYKDLKINVRLGEEVKTVEPIVKKIDTNYYFGSRVPFDEEISKEKVFEITFSHAGYKDVSLQELKADDDNIVECTPVIMEPLD